MEENILEFPLKGNCKELPTTKESIREDIINDLKMNEVFGRLDEREQNDLIDYIYNKYSPEGLWGEQEAEAE